jgi:hypothetical protein
MGLAASEEIGPDPCTFSVNTLQLPASICFKPLILQARTFFRLDATRCLKLYELWTSLGWVSALQPSNKGGGAPHSTPLPPIPGGAASLKRLSGSNTGLAGSSTGMDWVRPSSENKSVDVCW